MLGYEGKETREQKKEEEEDVSKGKKVWVGKGLRQIVL